MEMVFPAGRNAPPGGPLARFMPPLDEGMATEALAGFGQKGDLVLDPFGASPRLAVEAARAGRAVIVAANNPVTRFILRHRARPLALATLQAALARLAAAPKDHGRLEPFILDLYRTECSRCGETAIADYFVWERDAEGPILRGYVCEHCGHAGEDPTTEADWARAREHSRRGLQQALALEQVAPAGDPDRQHAEAALAVYPARAIYALISIVSKLDQLGLDPGMAAAAQALLLSASDAANALWGHPEGRARPLALIASPRFREINVWRALERAVDEWTMPGPEVSLGDWEPGKLPDPGTVAVYPGPARDLVGGLPTGAVRALFTVLPRPNQAYWTLSALWAAWLWGRAAAAQVKVALRRRRYDWAWHAGALRTALAGLSPLLVSETPALALMPEAEVGFVASALAGFDGAGFRLMGRALRADEDQGVFAWRYETGPRPAPRSGMQDQMTVAAVEALRRRGEPASYLIMHAAAWCDLANDRQLAPLWDAEDANPVVALSVTTEAAFGDRRLFVRLGAGAEPETGLYWLTDPTGAALPLADRVEALVVGVLRSTEDLSEVEIDRRVCAALPGIETPDRRLVQACLRSYASFDEATGLWHLREEDRAEVRAADAAEIRDLLRDLGARLGFVVQGGEPITWSGASGSPAFIFSVREQAALGDRARAAQAGPVTYVLPGGRAALVAEMVRRDPTLREWLARAGRVVKFRHIRRLGAETTLRADNLAERLAIDPPEHRDPQLPLL
jgi:hypothetical protein